MYKKINKSWIKTNIKDKIIIIQIILLIFLPYKLTNKKVIYKLLKVYKAYKPNIGWCFYSNFLNAWIFVKKYFSHTGICKLFFFIFYFKYFLKNSLNKISST